MTTCDLNPNMSYVKVKDVEEISYYPINRLDF